MGWTIDGGIVTKEGMVRVTDCEDPGGRFVIADNIVRNISYGPYLSEGSAEFWITVMCLFVLSRADVREHLLLEEQDGDQGA